MMINIENVITAYIECALWSSMDNADDSGGNPMDENYFKSDIAPDTLASMRDDCNAFVKEALELIAATGASDSQVGHDFWLTRNHHGAGFWDRGYGEAGNALTKIAHSYGGVDLYVGDDGLIYS